MLAKHWNTLLPDHRSGYVALSDMGLRMEGRPRQRSALRFLAEFHSFCTGAMTSEYNATTNRGSCEALFSGWAALGCRTITQTHDE
jgi:hypothetical protein